MNATQKKGKRKIGRREALVKMGAVAAGTLAASCARGTELPGILEGFLQRHFREMSVEELSRVLRELERKYSQEYGKSIAVKADGPLPGTFFAYALDISRCIGCRRCVYGCVEENNLSRSPQIHWITVLEMDKDKGVDLQHSTPYYQHELVPDPEKFYFPVACQQCRQPPCVKVCPVKATWQEPDGITVVDYDWCVGCRCCITACPYGARHFNWKRPEVPAAEVNPQTHYLGNRPRSRGVVEKCTFCIQRVRQGLYPKCVEVCPVGARKFGNLLDRQSEIRYIIEHKRVFVLKQELNTQPKFYYYYGF